MAKNADGLTPKQERFVSEYLVDLNATQAAIRAGYSEKTAGSIGDENLKKPAIAIEVKKRLDASTRKAHLTVERIDQEIARLAFVDTRKLYNADGTAKLPHEWDDDTAAAVAGMDIAEMWEGQGADRKQVGVLKKFKVWDKPAALTLAARRLKLLTDKIEHGGEVTLRALLDQSYAKAEDAKS